MLLVIRESVTIFTCRKSCPDRWVCQDSVSSNRGTSRNRHFSDNQNFQLYVYVFLNYLTAVTQPQKLIYGLVESYQHIDWDFQMEHILFFGGNIVRKYLIFGLLGDWWKAVPKSGDTQSDTLCFESFSGTGTAFFTFLNRDWMCFLPLFPESKTIQILNPARAYYVT